MTLLSAAQRDRNIAEIEAAVPSTWATSRQIWQSLGMWSLLWIKIRLNELAKAGRIEKRSTPSQTKQNNPVMYRRKPV